MRHGYFYARSREYRKTSPDQRVLVALVPTKRDWEIVREHGWYRVPVRSAPKPMEFGCLAFYQGRKEFGAQAWTINYRTQVKSIEIVKRRDLFPDELHHARANEDYYQISFDELRPLPSPIISHRQRFIVFISTTLNKLEQATEINDLFHDSPLEDEIWDGFKAERIEAERQWYLKASKQSYCLDFAIFCANGKVDVECDGDTWHSDPDRIPEDNARNNTLASNGWSVLRFNTKQITQELSLCLYNVRETVNRYGGIVSANGERRWLSSGDDQSRQLPLF